MRNIKYKLYSPSWNKVFRVVSIKFNEQGLIETVAVPMKDALPEHYGDTDLVLDLYPKDKIELLEFTGHYDVEGNEIYAGYIVSFVASDKNYIGVVEWSNEYASFLVKVKDYYEEYLSEIDEILILGNIYENKELINETTEV
nr:MAG TPA: YopX protein [Caudoviricetes sp.]